jgi:hypothetical protein
MAPKQTQAKEMKLLPPNQRGVEQAHAAECLFRFASFAPADAFRSAARFWLIDCCTYTMQP